MTQIYKIGTATVTNGSTTVSGTDTGWQTALVTGGLFTRNGLTVPIESVESDTALTLALPWPGSSGTGVYAIVREQSAAASIINLNDRAAQILIHRFIAGLIPAGDWASDRVYVTGEYVQHGGRTFASLIEDNEDNEPPDADEDDANWMWIPTVAGGDGEPGPPGPGLTPAGEWDAETVYATGAYVQHGSRTFASKIADNEGNEPPDADEDDAHWMWVPTVAGPTGANAFVYVAYASDDTGSDFTLTFDAGLDYIAVLSTDTAIETPVAGDFAGLWKRYKGDKGDKGDQGDQGEDFAPDEVVALIADRDAFDDEPKGFAVLVESDEDHDGDPWLYFKASGDSADWTGGVPFGSGGGSGDMEAAVYDPQGIAGDAFDTDYHTDGSVNGVYTLAERSKLAGIEASADVTDAGNVGSSIHGASGKTTPVDADTVPLIDSADSNALKKVTFANLWAWVQSKFNGTAKSSPVAADRVFIGDSAASNAVKYSTFTQIMGLVGALINGSTGKTTPVDADEIVIADSAASSATKKVSLTNLWANYLLSKVFGTENVTLTGGATVTSKSLGTQSSGTLTLDMGDRPLQHYTNNGAHTLAPGSVNGFCLVDITNDSSAGPITTSGWTKVDGDIFTTTNGHKFRCHCSVGDGGSLLIVEALQ